MLTIISQNLHQRYQDLITKKFYGGGLSPEEEKTLAQIELALDEEEAPSYERLKRSLRDMLSKLRNGPDQI